MTPITPPDPLVEALREQWRALLADDCVAMNVGCYEAERMNGAVERACARIEVDSELLRLADEMARHLNMMFYLDTPDRDEEGYAVALGDAYSVARVYADARACREGGKR